MGIGPAHIARAGVAIPCHSRHRAADHKANGRATDSWQYELAATLCLVGCIALPEEVFEKAYCGQTLSPDEERMFRAHPERAARLLSNIPRLEAVAEIIRGQQKPGRSPMLHLALELDRRIYRGATSGSALAELVVAPIRRPHAGCARQITLQRKWSSKCGGYRFESFAPAW